MLSLVKVRDGFQVTIPEEARSLVKEGGYFEVLKKGRELIFRVKDVQAEALQVKLDRGLEEVRVGNLIGPFERVEDIDSAFQNIK